MSNLAWWICGIQNINFLEELLMSLTRIEEMGWIKLIRVNIRVWDVQEINLDNTVYLLLYQSETIKGMDYNKHKVLIQKVLPACIAQCTLTLLVWRHVINVFENKYFTSTCLNISCIASMKE